MTAGYSVTNNARRGSDGAEARCVPSRSPTLADSKASRRSSTARPAPRRWPAPRQIRPSRGDSFSGVAAEGEAAEMRGVEVDVRHADVRDAAEVVAAVAGFGAARRNGDGAADQSGDREQASRVSTSIQISDASRSIRRSGRSGVLIPPAALLRRDHRPAHPVFLRQPEAAIAFGVGTEVAMARINGDARPRSRGKVAARHGGGFGMVCVPRLSGRREKAIDAKGHRQKPANNPIFSYGPRHNDAQTPMANARAFRSRRQQSYAPVTAVGL